MFPLFIFFVWILISFAPLLEKKAKKQSGGVSLFNGIVIMPLLAWFLAWGLNQIRDNLGFYLVGGLHVGILVALLISGLKWLLQIKRNARIDRSGNG
jgi:hypothetical protein